MSVFQYRNGLGNSAAYQVSGRPFATGAIALPALDGTPPVEINFPSVTKSITVLLPSTATGNLRIGFSASGVSGSAASNYIILELQTSPPQTSQVTLDTKVESIFLSGDATNKGSTCYVYASLTNIPTGSIADNWSGSIGVG
jgi:hypothetical protein